MRLFEMTGALVRGYRVPALLGSAMNILLGVAVRSALPRRVLGLAARVSAYALAGLAGGLTAAAEAFAVVEMLDWQQEAAGLALVFLPFLLAPTTVATLVWLFGES